MGAVRDFGTSCLPGSTSRLAAISMNVNRQYRLAVSLARRTRFACGESPFRQKEPTLTTIRDCTRINGCSPRFRYVLFAQDDLTAVRDFGATGLIKPVAILSPLHTWLTLRQQENPFRQKGPVLTVNRNDTRSWSPDLLVKRVLFQQCCELAGVAETFLRVRTGFYNRRGDANKIATESIFLGGPKLSKCVHAHDHLFFSCRVSHSQR
jgi:hypothetical protein